VVLVFLRRPEAIEPLMLAPVSGIHYDDELIHVSFNKGSSMRLISVSCIQILLFLEFIFLQQGF
jgi:hypothetical protein